MKTRFKTLALASALAFGAVAPAGAAFVKPVISYTAAAAAATAALVPADAISSNANASLTGTHAVREKSSLLKRIGKRLGAMAGKSQIVALILVLAVGTLGIHRFYLGYTWQGIVQLLTLGGFGIWTLIDLIRIIIGDLEPKDGSYDQTL